MALTGLTGIQISNLNVSGIATFEQTVGIAGTLTYEDVTNVDSVGLVTARDGIKVSGGQVLVGSGTSLHSTGLDLGTGNITGHNLKSTGIITATSFVGSGANLTGIDTDLVSDTSPQLGGDLQSNGSDIDIADNDRIYIGTDNDTQIYDNNVNTYIDSNLHKLRLQVGDNRQIILEHRSDGDYMALFKDSGSVDLYYSGSKKFETTNTGAVVTGILTATNNLTAASINVGSNIQVGNAGIITATNIELAIPTSRRNFFINGGMYVAARGTVTGLNAGGFGGPDHIKLVNNLGTFTVAQGNENESPRSEGFTYCYKLNCTSASGPSASNYVYLHHEFSGYDLQLLRYGYTNPHPITISFWAKCNKTGNFTVTFRTVAGVNRLISKVLTISDSNWNFYSVTFVGDTSVVNVTAGGAYILEIWLDGGTNYTGGTVQTSWSAKDNADRGAGSTLNIASSTSNYFYYTGLQIELGTVATPFEHQLYQWYEHECYRFFYHPNRGSDLLELHGMGHRVADTMGAVVQAYPWPRQMRATPTVSFDDNAGNSNKFAVNGSNNTTYTNQSLSLQQNDQGIMGAFQYPHGLTGISENESFRLWAYNFKAEAEF